MNLRTSKKHEKVISNGELDNAREQVRAQASETRYLGNRLVWDRKADTIYLNLADKEGRVVKITPDKDGNGFEIVKNSDVLLFKRLPESKTQVVPSKNFARNRRYLRETTAHINFKYDHHRLIDEVYHASLMLPDINHPVHSPYGEEKSGKTLIQVIKKDTIDPDRAEGPTWASRLAPSMPAYESDERKEWDRATFIESNYITYHDNTNELTFKQMDEACKWCYPGYSKTKEAKYKNKVLISVVGVRPIGFNGINRPGTKGDFQSRLFGPALTQPEDGTGKDFEEVIDGIDKEKAEIVGYLCSLASKFLYYLPLLRVKGDRLPWTKHAEVMSQCLGNEGGQFLEAWKLNTLDQVEATIGDSTLAKAVIKYGERSETNMVEPQPEALYVQLRSIAYEISPNLENDRTFPISASTLSKYLNSISGSLKKVGIIISVGEKDRAGNRIIRITYPERPRPISFCKNEPLFLQIFSDMARESQDGIVSGQQLKAQLVSSGKFVAGEAYQAIQDAHKAEVIDKVDFDAYRLKATRAEGI